VEDNKCQAIIDSYVQWLKGEMTAIKTKEGLCEITTPFIDKNNDYIQVYMYEREGALVFTDGGYSLSELETSGIDLVARKQEIFDEILRSFGVTLEGRQLTVVTSLEEAPQRKHDLVQAMLAINDMYVLARPSTVKFFKQEVENYFEENGIRYSANVRLIGKSGYSQPFDFIIPRFQKKPERVIKALAHPDKNTASSYMWQVSDVRNARREELEALAVMNDIDFPVKPEIDQAFKQYLIVPFRWSQRENLVSTLKD
jgi:hypothetical protein